MRPPCHSYDLVVIGGGPAGQKAAIQGAKADCRVLVVHEDVRVGGACVRRGTIPSKTLRETAVALTGFKKRSGHAIDVRMREGLELEMLMTRMREVVAVHERYMGDQLRRNGIELWHGRASFVSPHEIAVQSIDGATRRARAPAYIVATGSRPRAPSALPIDHEHVLDSDSILSLAYLPASLVVVGGGIVGSEYASIFAALGVEVTIVDRQDRPVAFLDREITARFREGFEANGGRFLGGQTIERLEWDGVASVVTTLEGGRQLRSEKALIALGRVANLDRLDLGAARLEPNARGLLDVDEHCRTAVKHIYAVGDVVGPPALASSSMEQGRRAACHAVGVQCSTPAEMIPVGVYTIPEMASVGLSEEQARSSHGDVIVGRARFEEMARGQIAAIQDGMLKMIADRTGERLLGVQIVGEGAADLVHVGQMALLGGLGVDSFVENIFNFPTLAEAYRVAALDVVRQRPEAASFPSTRSYGSGEAAVPAE